MINRELLQQSVRIFDSMEKWNALFDIYAQTGAIIEAWMEVGAEALRSDFAFRKSPGWTCEEWEVKRETQWFLTELGKDSIGLVFAWPTWEFHLLYKATATIGDVEAKRLIELPEFQPLRAMFSMEPVQGKSGYYRPLASDLNFNPVGEAVETVSRPRELAWYASHETERFVGEMSKYVRRITDNPTLTALVRELNNRAKRAPNAVTPP